MSDPVGVKIPFEFDDAPAEQQLAGLQTRSIAVGAAIGSAIGSGLAGLAHSAVNAGVQAVAAHIATLQDATAKLGHDTTVALQQASTSWGDFAMRVKVAASLREDIQRITASWEDFGLRVMLANEKAGAAATKHAENVAKLNREYVEHVRTLNEARTRLEELDRASRDAAAAKSEGGLIWMWWLGRNAKKSAAEAAAQADATAKKIQAENEAAAQAIHTDQLVWQRKTEDEKRKLILATEMALANDRKRIALQTAAEIAQIESSKNPYAEQLVQATRVKGAAELAAFDKRVRLAREEESRRAAEAVAAQEEKASRAEFEARHEAFALLEAGGDEHRARELSSLERHYEGEMRRLEGNLGAQLEVLDEYERRKAVLRAQWADKDLQVQLAEEAKRIDAGRFGDAFGQTGDLRLAQELLRTQNHYNEMRKLAGENYDLLRALDEGYARDKERILRRSNALEMELAQFGTNALRSLAGSLGNAFGGLVSHVAAYDRALEASGGAHRQFADDAGASIAKFVQDTLAGVATQAATLAVYETALGFASLIPGIGVIGGMSSTQHFTAAAIFAGIAAGTGGLAYGIGEVRGLTGAEKQSAYGYSGSGTSLGGREGNGRAVSSAPAVQVIRETVIVPGGELFTPAEVAARMARYQRLQGQLNIATS